MSILATLRGRILIASFFLAVVVGAAFTVLIVSIQDTREAARVAERSERVASAANLLERLLLDLETGQRAYVITGRRSFLEPWDAALRRYPVAAADLQELVVDPAQRRRIDQIAEEMDAYVNEWSQPVVDTVAVDRAEAAKLVATGEGKRRVDRLRENFDRFAARQRELTEERAEVADQSERRAIVLGLCGIAICVLLVFLFASYLVRSTIEPVEDVARAARRLREGDLTARAKERAGTDESAELTRDFNAMAHTLAANVEEQARQRAELAAVLDSATEGIAMTDPDGTLVFTNERMDAFWRDLGVAEKGSIWSRIAGLAELTGEAESYAPAFAQLASDPEAVLEDDFDVPSLQRSFHGFTGPVRGPSGSVIGRIFALRETTRERAAEQAKDEFLSTVSHELRTPLTSIRGYLELVRDGEVGEVTSDQDRFLGIVDRSAQHLGSLVDDLLVVGRMAEGRLDLDRAEVDLAEVAAECVESAANVAEEKRIVLRLDAEPGLVLLGDRRRLTQLVTNLLGNAIKFTPEGGHVDVRAVRNGDRALLEVADDGIGIPEDEQERLFERFFRASSASAAQVPGTGLGLAISKAIAEAHDGTIGVSSTGGEGTTFRVELPLEDGR